VATTQAARRGHGPLYCTINHKHGIDQHARLITEVEVESEHALVAVNLVRRNDADEIELAIGKGWGEPAITDMTVDEARALRDALDVAVAVLDRT
jgi:hypothetical protein